MNDDFIWAPHCLHCLGSRWFQEVENGKLTPFPFTPEAADRNQQWVGWRVRGLWWRKGLSHFFKGFYTCQVVQDSFHQQLPPTFLFNLLFFSPLKHDNLLGFLGFFCRLLMEIYNYTCCSFLNVLLMLRQPQIWSIGWMGRWKKQKDEKWPLLSDQQNVSLSWVPFPGGFHLFDWHFNGTNLS